MLFVFTAVDNEEEEDDDVEFVPPKELCLPRSMLYVSILFFINLKFLSLINIHCATFE